MKNKQSSQILKKALPKSLSDFGFMPSILVALLILLFCTTTWAYSQWLGYQEMNTLSARVASESVSLREYPQILAMKAAQDSAEWAYALVWIGAISSMSGLVGIYLVARNLSAIHAQNQVMREIDEAGERQPLLLSGDCKLELLKFSADNYAARVGVTIINTAARPIWNAKIRAECFAANVSVLTNKRNRPDQLKTIHLFSQSSSVAAIAPGERSDLELSGFGISIQELLELDEQSQTQMPLASTVVIWTRFTIECENTRRSPCIPSFFWALCVLDLGDLKTEIAKKEFGSFRRTFMQSTLEPYEWGVAKLETPALDLDNWKLSLEAESELRKKASRRVD